MKTGIYHVNRKNLKFHIRVHFYKIYLAILLSWYPSSPCIQVPFSSKSGLFIRLCSLVCVNSLQKSIICISLIRKKYCFWINKISSLSLLCIGSTNARSRLFMRCGTHTEHWFSMEIHGDPVTSIWSLYVELVT